MCVPFPRASGGPLRQLCLTKAFAGQYIMISKPQSTLHSDGTKSVLWHLHVRDLVLISPADGSVFARLTGTEELFLKATLCILWVALAQGVRGSDCECMAPQLPLLPTDKSQLEGSQVLGTGMGLVS